MRKREEGGDYDAAMSGGGEMGEGGRKGEESCETRNEVALTMEPMKAILLAFYIIYLRVHSSSDTRGLQLCSTPEYSRVVFELCGKSHFVSCTRQGPRGLIHIGRKFALVWRICDSSALSRLFDGSPRTRRVFTTTSRVYPHTRHFAISFLHSAR